MRHPLRRALHGPVGGERWLGRRRARAVIRTFALVALALLAFAGSAQAGDPQPSDVERRFVGLLNEERVSRGLPRVEISPTLTAISDDYVAENVREGGLDHDRDAPYTARAHAAGCDEFSWQGPVLSQLGPSPRAVLDGWLESQDHRIVLLDPDVTHIGPGFQGEHALAYLLPCPSDARHTSGDFGSTGSSADGSSDIRNLTLNDDVRVTDGQLVTLGGRVTCAVNVGYGVIAKVTQGDTQAVGAFGPNSAGSGGLADDQPCGPGGRSFDLTVQAGGGSTFTSGPVQATLQVGTSAENGRRGPGPIVGDLEIVTLNGGAGDGPSGAGDIRGLSLTGAATNGRFVTLRGRVTCAVNLDYGLTASVVQGGIQAVGAFGPTSTGSGGLADDQPCGPEGRPFEVTVEAGGGSAFTDGPLTATLQVGTSAENGRRGPGPIVGDLEIVRASRR